MDTRPQRSFPGTRHEHGADPVPVHVTGARRCRCRGSARSSSPLGRELSYATCSIKTRAAALPQWVSSPGSASGRDGGSAGQAGTVTPQGHPGGERSCCNLREPPRPRSHHGLAAGRPRSQQHHGLCRRGRGSGSRAGSGSGAVTALPASCPEEQHPPAQQPLPGTATSAPHPGSAAEPGAQSQGGGSEGYPQRVGSLWQCLP